MRPICERCHAALPAAASGAFICSFECTFCAACNDSTLKGICPNCAGALSPRPTRVGAAFDQPPAIAKP